MSKNFKKQRKRVVRGPDPIRVAGQIIYDLRAELGDSKWFELKGAFYKALEYAEDRALERGHGSLKIHPATTPKESTPDWVEHHDFASGNPPIPTTPPKVDGGGE